MIEMTKEVEKYYEQMAEEHDFLEHSSRYLGRYGSLAVAILREKNPVRYCEKGLTEMLEEWALEINDQMTNRNIILVNELLESRPSPLEGDFLEKVRHRRELDEIAIELVRAELYDLIPVYEETPLIGELPF